MRADVSVKLLEKLKSKSYRDAYMAEHVRSGIAHQIRDIREYRGMSQKDLGQKMGKPQSVVSRIEDIEYGKCNVQTLIEFAQAFDVGLLVKFVSYQKFLNETHDNSKDANVVREFSAETPTSSSGGYLTAGTAPYGNIDSIVYLDGSKFLPNSSRMQPVKIESTRSDPVQIY